MFARRLTVVLLATTFPTTHRSVIVVVHLRFHHSSECRTLVLTHACAALLYRDLDS